MGPGHGENSMKSRFSEENIGSKFDCAGPIWMGVAHPLQLWVFRRLVSFSNIPMADYLLFVYSHLIRMGCPSTTTCPTLPEFPLELQIDILNKLDWKDVLRIRNGLDVLLIFIIRISVPIKWTCKALHEASKARSIWLKQCVPYLSPTIMTLEWYTWSVPSNVHIGRVRTPLLTVFGRRGCGIWMENGRQISIPRAEGCDDDSKALNPQCMHLVEDGRWLRLPQILAPLPTLTSTLEFPNHRKRSHSRPTWSHLKYLDVHAYGHGNSAFLT